MRVGLRWQVLLALASVLVVSVLLVSATVLGITWRTVTEQGHASARQTAILLSATAAAAVDTGSPLTSPANAENLQRLAEVTVDGAGDVALVVVDASGTVVASAPSQADEPPADVRALLVEIQRGDRTAVVQTGELSRPTVNVVTPLRVGEVTLGAMWLRQDLSASTRRLRQAQPVIVISIIMVALIVFTLGYALLTRAIVQPVRHLSQATERVTRGDPDARVRGRPGRGELGDLARNFDRMIDRIRDQRRQLEGQLAELAEANAQLEQAGREAIRAEKLATLGTLAAGIAHEVGNPLSAVIGLLELLDDAEDPSERADTQGRIRREVERMHGILRELLDYARLGDEPMASVAVIDSVEAACRLALHHRRARGLDVDIAIPADLPKALVSENRLVQVVLNLLLNAADAMEGRGTVRIRGWRVGPSAIALEVIDDGPGIPADRVERIFDPFYTTKAPGVGTGLGLAMVERIISGFGGTIAVDSGRDGGACFVMTLPTSDDASTSATRDPDAASVGVADTTVQGQDDRGSPGTPSGK